MKHTSTRCLILLLACACAPAWGQATKPAAAPAKATKKEPAAGKTAKGEAASAKGAHEKTAGGTAKAGATEKPSAKPAGKAAAGAKTANKAEAGKASAASQAPSAKPDAAQASAAKKAAARNAGVKAGAGGTAAKPEAGQAATRAGAGKVAAGTEAGKTAAKPEAGQASKPTRARTRPLSDEELKARLDSALKLAPEESVRELEEIVRNNPQSALRPRALELLTAARAALGDERLKAGDAERGVELFRLAVKDAPAEMPEDLYAKVVSQLPANLFLRGQSAAALELARAVEERVKDNPKRLLTLAAFYLRVEQPGEAARVAADAIRLAPDMSAAYMALGAAQRIALKLDEAASAYRRALELDPKSTPARRSLADLQRANGKPAEALGLYRELLAADPKDTSARAGAVLALFDAGQREDAERELKAALDDNPQDLPLLVGAAWWYVAHREPERAEELATRAVQLEPRYTWAQIALARALVAQKRPLEAERFLRIARQYGRFPTLDYELASVLAASGLYEEAAEELERSFRLKDGQLETQLAGRTPARADNFTDLLALERRASIFQPAAADTDANARTLKNLLAFHLLMKEAGGSTVYGKDSGAAEARAFASGDDDMLAFRQLYAASRLLKSGAALDDVLKLTEAATAQVETALNSPVAPTALLADELRDVRARALAGGGLPGVPQVPRNVLSNVMRGRIEDMAGWSLFIGGKPAEAVVRLKRATGVLPENSAWWRGAMWHLGAAQDATGNQKEALASYIKSYNRQSPDPARRAIIEGLYQRVNGSLKGLDELIGPAPAPYAEALVVTQNPTAPGTTTTGATNGTTNTPAATPNVPNATSTTSTTAGAATTPSDTTSAPPLTTNPAASTPAPSSNTATTPEAAAPTAPKPEATKETEAKPEVTPAPKQEAAPTSPAQPSSPASAPTSSSAAPASPTSTPEQAAALTTQPAPTPEASADTTPSPAAGDKQSSDEKQSAASNAAATPATPTPAGVDGSKPERRGAGPGGCAVSLSEESLHLAHGSSATVTLGTGEALDPAAVKATTADWSDIIVFAEPHAAGDAALKFTISSVGQKPGTYAVTFTTPCGTKKLSVTVK